MCRRCVPVPSVLLQRPAVDCGRSCAEINERQGTNEAIILAAKTRPSRNLNVRSVATDLDVVDPAKKNVGRYRRINISIARTFGTTTVFRESVIGAIREFLAVGFCHIEKQVSIRTEGGVIRRDCTCTAGARLGSRATHQMIIKRLIANLRDYPRNAD